MSSIFFLPVGESYLMKLGGFLNFYSRKTHGTRRPALSKDGGFPRAGWRNKPAASLERYAGIIKNLRRAAAPLAFTVNTQLLDYAKFKLARGRRRWRLKR